MLASVGRYFVEETTTRARNSSGIRWRDMHPLSRQRSQLRVDIVEVSQALAGGQH